MKKQDLKQAKSNDELIELKYGILGTSEREEFEEKAQYFVISEILKDSRKEAKMTQEDLAIKVGTKKKLYFKIRKRKMRYSTFYFVSNF